MIHHYNSIICYSYVIQKFNSWLRLVFLMLHLRYMFDWIQRLNFNDWELCTGYNVDTIAGVCMFPGEDMGDRKPMIIGYLNLLLLKDYNDDLGCWLFYPGPVLRNMVPCAGGQKRAPILRVDRDPVATLTVAGSKGPLLVGKMYSLSFQAFNITQKVMSF